jgi:PhoPQ-activated pathogenicity-related protein
MKEVSVATIPTKVNERVLREALSTLNVKMRYQAAGTVTLPDNITTEAVPANMVLYVPDGVDEQQALNIVSLHNPQKTEDEEKRESSLDAVRRNPVIANILQRLEALENK